ncbi:MAG: hypothetical protein ACE5JM_09355, partial [Armatimonadota bacterium]
MRWPTVLVSAVLVVVMAALVMSALTRQGVQNTTCFAESARRLVDLPLRQTWLLPARDVGAPYANHPPLSVWLLAISYWPQSPAVRSLAWASGVSLLFALSGMALWALALRSAGETSGNIALWLGLAASAYMLYAHVGEFDTQLAPSMLGVAILVFVAARDATWARNRQTPQWLRMLIACVVPS